MIVKYLHWIGMAACLMLVVSCFLPWVYYADLNQTFTGFYSYNNEYGKPGKFFLIFGSLALMCMLLPKVWAKRANLFICALTVAYAIKTFILFSSCYNNYCPQKLFAIYLMVGSTLVMLLSSFFPNLKISPSPKK